MAKAAIVTTLKGVDKSANQKIPKFIIDCCKEVKSEYFAILLNKAFSNTSHSLRKFIFLRAYNAREFLGELELPKWIWQDLSPNGHTITKENQRPH